VANENSNNVSVLLGNGDGTFRPAVNYAVDGHPLSVAVGDFNGDGTPDVVTANYDTNTVSILQGNGDGTFQAAVNYAVGHSPRAVLVGDFRGDGESDLAIANRASNSVSVLLNNGNGTFQAAVNYPTGNGPLSLAAADFNQDGNLDLVTANWSSGTVSVLLGNGDGTFQTRLDYSSAGANPWSVATGDFNGDGYPDLVVANRNSSSVTVLTNDAHWGPAPRPAGHGPRELPSLIPAVRDIAWPSTPDPQSLSPTPTEASVLRAVLDNRQGSVGLPTWARATNPPLGQRDAASQAAGSRDLLFAGWDSGWLDALMVRSARCTAWATLSCLQRLQRPADVVR
jgi:hypothetical protein